MSLFKVLKQLFIILSYISFLVGNGAHVWAQKMGIQTLPPEQLISSK